MNTAQRIDGVDSINRSREPSSSGNLVDPPIIGQPREEVRAYEGTTSAQAFEPAVWVFDHYQYLLTIIWRYYTCSSYSVSGNQGYVSTGDGESRCFSRHIEFDQIGYGVLYTSWNRFTRLLNWFNGKKPEKVTCTFCESYFSLNLSSVRSFRACNCFP